MAAQPLPQQPEPPRQPIVVVQQAPRNGLGTSSFVLGLIGAIFGLVPIGAFVALPVSLVGLGLGLGNIGRLRHHVADNKVMTWIGIAFSLLGIILSIIGITIINNAVSNL